VRLDPAKNARSPFVEDTDIAAPDARVRVLVIHAQEDWMIARQCCELVKIQSSPLMIP
jgi:acetate kinase